MKGKNITFYAKNRNKHFSIFVIEEKGGPVRPCLRKRRTGFMKKVLFL